MPSDLQYPEDEYLFEIDDNPNASDNSGMPWTFTERAKRAQAAVSVTSRQFLISY